MSESMVEKVARAIAIGMGDDFDHAFTGKAEWNAERGEKGGRYRDINEPYQGDYLDAARAAIEVMKGTTEVMEALSSAEAWLARWASHVGSCRGGDLCNCGLTAVLHEAHAALSNTEAREP